MQVNRSDLEAFWREAWLDAPDGAVTFYEKLTDSWRQLRAQNAAGSLSNISANQSAHGYATPSPNTRTTVDAERIGLEAIKFYESLQLDLDVERDEAGELAVYNEGLARLAVSATETYHDFSLMRAGVV